jgi:hypothetical protein
MIHDSSVRLDRENYDNFQEVWEHHARCWPIRPDGGTAKNDAPFPMMMLARLQCCPAHCDDAMKIATRSASRDSPICLACITDTQDWPFQPDEWTHRGWHIEPYTPTA